MGCKPIHKMPIRERAKQFMPFSPLKGLEDAIVAQEMKVLKRPRASISSDQAEMLNRKMQEVQLGDEISLTHYEKGVYVTTFGKIEEINMTKQYIKTNGKNIMFSDIFDIM